MRIFGVLSLSMLLLCALAPTTLLANICSLSEHANRAQQELANSLHRHHGVSSIHLRDLSAAHMAECQLMVSVGSSADSRLISWPGPVLHAMIAREQYQALYQDGAPYPRSAVFMDQPLERYVALIHSAMPGHSEVLLLSSENTLHLVTPLLNLLKAHRKALRIAPYTQGDSIDKILAENTGPNSVLLVLPDIRVLNSDTAKTFITASYQRAIPLVSYSDHLVRAGGLMAVYSSAEDQLEDVRDAIHIWQATGLLPAAGYTRNYSVAINYQLARALQLRLPTEAMVLRAMQLVIADD